MTLAALRLAGDLKRNGITLAGNHVEREQGGDAEEAEASRVGWHRGSTAAGPAVCTL